MSSLSSAPLDSSLPIKPFVMMKHITQVARDAGVGPSRETQMVADLSDGARAFLVAIIAYSTPDENTQIRSHNPNFSSNLKMVLSTSEMRSAFLNYKALKPIGFDASEDSIRRYIDELQCAALIEGGISKFGGARSFTGGRSDDYQKVMIELQCISFQTIDLFNVYFICHYLIVINFQ